MIKRYYIMPIFLGYIIMDGILNKSVSPVYDTKKYAKKNLDEMIANGELKQLSYKEVLK